MCGGVPAVVMLSSEEMVTPLKKCLTLGADAFRLKPLNTTELNELVQYTLRKRQYVTERLSRSQSPLRSPNFRLLDEAEQATIRVRVGARVRVRSDPNPNPNPNPNLGRVAQVLLLELVLVVDAPRLVELDVRRGVLHQVPG